MAEVQGVVHYTVRPESHVAFRRLLDEFVAAVRAEPGNISFFAHRRLDDELTYVLLGRYVSREALAAHRESAHFARLMLDGIAPLLSSRNVEVFDVPAGGA